MSWKDEYALKRIFNTFKRLKSNIFEQDIEALKTINESLENSKIDCVNDNLLFAKLLSVVLRQNLVYFGDMQMAIKSTQDIFSEPLEYHLAFLQKSLNETDKINYFKNIVINIDSDKRQDKIITDHQQKIIEKLNTNWTIENVRKSFFNSANTFLKDLNNYK